MLDLLSFLSFLGTVIFGLWFVVNTIKSKPDKKITYAFVASVIIFLTCFVFLPTGNNTTSPQKQEESVKKTPSSNNQQNKDESIAIGNVAGLGDTRELLTAKYGEPKDPGGTKIYKNGKMIVIEGTGTRAFNITVYIHSSSIEPMEKIKDFLPKDAKTIQDMKNTNEGEGKSIYLGESAALSKVFNTGKFIVIRKVDKAAKQNSFIIGIGDQP